MVAETRDCPSREFPIPAGATVCGHCGASEQLGFTSRWGLLFLVVWGLFGVVIMLLGSFAVLVMFYGGARYQNPNNFGAFLAMMFLVGIVVGPILLLLRTRKKRWFPRWQPETTYPYRYR